MNHDIAHKLSLIIIDRSSLPREFRDSAMYFVNLQDRLTERFGTVVAGRTKGAAEGSSNELFPMQVAHRALEAALRIAPEGSAEQHFLRVNLLIARSGDGYAMIVYGPPAEIWAAVDEYARASGLPDSTENSFSLFHGLWMPDVCSTFDLDTELRDAAAAMAVREAGIRPVVRYLRGETERAGTTKDITDAMHRQKLPTKSIVEARTLLDHFGLQLHRVQVVDTGDPERRRRIEEESSAHRERRTIGAYPQPAPVTYVPLKAAEPVQNEPMPPLEIDVAGRLTFVALAPKAWPKDADLFQTSLALAQRLRKEFGVVTFQTVRTADQMLRAASELLSSRAGLTPAEHADRIREMLANEQALESTLRFSARMQILRDENEQLTGFVAAATPEQLEPVLRAFLDEHKVVGDVDERFFIAGGQWTGFGSNWLGFGRLFTAAAAQLAARDQDITTTLRYMLGDDVITLDTDATYRTSDTLGYPIETMLDFELGRVVAGLASFGVTVVNSDDDAIAQLLRTDREAFQRRAAESRQTAPADVQSAAPAEPSAGGAPATT